MREQTRRPFIVFSFSITFPCLFVDQSFIPGVGASWLTNMHSDLRFNPSSGVCINLVILYYLYYAGPLSCILGCNYCSYSKNASTASRRVAFLTFRSVSKHILFALGVNPTARDAGKGVRSDLVSQATPFAVSCGLVAIHVPSLHKSSIVKPRKTSSKCCRVCH